MSKRIRGMSTIDLLVILILCAVVGVGAMWSINKVGMSTALKGMGVLMLLSLVIHIPLWIHSDRQEKIHLKQLYEKGMVDKEHYRNTVGEKFYRKHHGDD